MSEKLKLNLRWIFFGRMIDPKSDVFNLMQEKAVPLSEALTHAGILLFNRYPGPFLFHCFFQL